MVENVKTIRLFFVFTDRDALKVVNLILAPVFPRNDCCAWQIVNKQLVLVSFLDRKLESVKQLIGDSYSALIGSAQSESVLNCYLAYNLLRKACVLGLHPAERHGMHQPLTNLLSCHTSSASKMQKVKTSFQNVVYSQKLGSFHLF